MFVCLALTNGVAAADAPVAKPGGHPVLPGFCVFSREAMFASSDISVASNARLQQLRGIAQAEANQSQAKLDADRKSFEEGQAGVSPALLQQLRERLAERTRDLASMIQLRTRELERTRELVTARIDAAAIPIIRETEQVNKCSVLFSRESVLDAPGMIDITNAVVAAMNSKLQPLTFERASLTP